MSDSLSRFIFDNYNIRGELINLDESVQQLLKNHNYPSLLADMLTEAVAINALMASTLKFEGRVSVQLQTPGKLKLLLVQTTHELSYRGIVRYDEDSDYSELNFKQLTEQGQLVITIEPLKGKRYQGVVALEGETLSSCVESYFNLSEQLKTRLWFYKGDSKAYGVLLQALPDMENETDFEHLEVLASTLTPEECFSLDNETILHRLFHNESVKNLAEDPVIYQCACSRDKMLSSIQLLGDEEVEEILATEGEISVQCEFCLNKYAFDKLDIKQHQSHQGNDTKH